MKVIIEFYFTRAARRLLIYLALAFLLIIGLVTVIRGQSKEEYYIDPEYERKLEKVLISLDVNSSDLSLYSELLRSLPEYTELFFLLPGDRMEAIWEDLLRLHLEERSSLIPFDISSVRNADVYLLFPDGDKVYSAPMASMNIPRGSVWAQDLFEIAHTRKDESYVLMPEVHKWFLTADEDHEHHVISDNIFVDNLSSIGYRMSRIPATFKGGNVVIDKLGKKRIAFLGGDVIRETGMVLKETATVKVRSDEEILEMLREYLNVDDVVVVGKGRRQPSLMFHLDQAMVILPSGVALVTRIVNKQGDDLYRNDIEDVEAFLSELRTELKRQGYVIVDIQESVDDIDNFRYYVNGIPYRNSRTHKNEFLMPTFRDATTPEENRILVENVLRIESLGYDVIMVPTIANKSQGGIHCLVNVIS